MNCELQLNIVNELMRKGLRKQSNISVFLSHLNITQWYMLRHVCDVSNMDTQIVYRV